MAQTTIYIIDSTDGTGSFAIQPRTYDGSEGVQRNTDLTLYGNAYPNWGERFNENFYRLLENFACPDKGALGSPVTVTGVPQDESDLGAGQGINTPITGQLWFNKTDSKLYVYDGAAWSILNENDFVQLTGDTMSGKLTIDGGATTGDLLEVTSEDGPQLTIMATTTTGSAGGIRLYNPENDPTAGGVSGTDGWTKLVNRDGHVLTIERDNTDNDMSESPDVLIIDQDGEMRFYGAGVGAYNGDIRIPNASITEDDHVTTKLFVEDYVDTYVGANISGGVKNHFINGDMRFWQRGTLFSLGSNREYTADRWNAGLGGSGTTVTRSTDVPSSTGGAYSLRIQSTTDVTRIRQAVELPRVGNPGPYLVGTNWVLSFDIKTSDSTPMLCRGYFRDVVDSSANQVSVSSGSTPTLPISTWTRVEVPMTITASPNGTNNSFTMLIDFPLGVNAYITNIQFEKGSVATEFESRTYGTELALCQRYYEKSYEIETVPGTITGGSGGCKGFDQSINNTWHAWIPFKVTKRISPTCSVYNPRTGNINEMNWIHDDGGNTGAQPVNAVAATEQAIYSISVTSAADNSDNTLAAVEFVADAEL